MYSRILNGKTLSFGHEGVLFRNSFVMYDHQTDTLWLHTTGEAIKGKLKGEELRFLPSTITRWSRWKELHPQTTALVGRQARGFMGTLALDRRPERFGLGLGAGDTAKLYPLRDLKKLTVINDRFDGRPVAIIYDRESQSALAFVASAKGQDLTFQPSDETSEEGWPLMRDRETNSRWLRLQGRCIDGKLAGEELAQEPGTPWLIERWQGFYPKGPIYAPPKGEGF